VSNIFDRPQSALSNGALGRAMASSSERLSNLLKAPPCPRCSAPMWLARLEPHPTPDGGADDMIYECACGEQLTRTVEAR
jgi:hypothetical protein